MGSDKRKKMIDDTKTLLQAELKRILELLKNNNLDLGYSYNTYKEKAELKNKMLEARRDMVRLEKLLYDYELEVEE